MLYLYIVYIVVSSVAEIKGLNMGEVKYSDEQRIEMRRIASGGGYVGSGYDILKGNPYGDSVGSGGIDQGLRPSRFIFEKTFSSPDSYCPEEAVCTDLAGSMELSSSQVFFDMIDYQTGINRSWEGGLKITNISKYLASFGGSLSNGYGKMQRKIETEYHVIIDNSTTKIYAEASLNYGSQGFLSAEFVSHLCGLSLNYSQSEYLDLIRDWGTHVILRTQIGERQISRRVFSGQNVTEFFSKTHQDCVSAEGSFLKFFTGHINRDESGSLIYGITSNVKQQDFQMISSGSVDNPVPITLFLVPLDHCISKKYIRPGTIQSLSHLKCEHLLQEASLCKIQLNFAQALKDYPTVDRAVSPSPIWRNFSIPKPPEKIYWPKGTYSLIAPSTGCPPPSGSWAKGWRDSGLDETGSASEGFSSVADISAGSSIKLHFCTKTGEFPDEAGNGGLWPAGSYCFFTKSGCPASFSLGTFYNDDNDAEFFWFASGDSSSGGTLPDGHYTDTETKFFFCCRNDGSHTSAIKLPLTPFILLPTEKKLMCQYVMGMQSVLHHIDWYGENDYNNYASGIYVQYSGKRWTMYFCYYYPTRSFVGTNKNQACKRQKSSYDYHSILLNVTKSDNTGHNNTELNTTTKPITVVDELEQCERLNLDYLTSSSFENRGTYIMVSIILVLIPTF